MFNLYVFTTKLSIYYINILTQQNEDIWGGGNPKTDYLSVFLLQAFLKYSTTKKCSDISDSR